MRIMIEGIEFEIPENAITTRGLLYVMEPAVGGFASVGGYEKVKEFLRIRVIHILNHRDLAAKMALYVPRGIILFGPPGTGRSLVTRALAAELNLSIFGLVTENFCRCSWGYSITQQIGDAIRLAENRGPAIVYIDEIDRLLPRRKSGGAFDDASRQMGKVHNLVLEWLAQKDPKSILIGTTYRPEDIDAAVLKRVDYMIPMLYPDAKGRRDIVMVHLGLKGGKRVPLALTPEETESVIEFLAKETQYFRGTELEHLVNKAKRLAFASRVDALTAEHFYEALQTTRIDRDRRERDVEHYLGLAREYSTDSDLIQPICKV